MEAMMTLGWRDRLRAEPQEQDGVSLIDELQAETGGIINKDCGLRDFGQEGYS